MSQTKRAALLAKLSYLLKAIWIFFPGILFLLLGLFLFLKLPQGQDIIYQSTDSKRSWLTGIYLVLAAMFWIFTTWYTARLVAYDRNDLYRKAPGILFHIPRLMAFSIFLVIWLAVYLVDDIASKKKAEAWLAVGIDLLVYWFFHLIIVNLLAPPIDASRRKRLTIIRAIVRLLIIAACVAIVIGWGQRNIRVLLYTLPILQIGFLFLVIARFPLYESNPAHAGQQRQLLTAEGKKLTRWERYVNWAFKTTFQGFRIDFEKPVFIVYHSMAVIAILCYLACINWLAFARNLTSFPLVLLAFGILLGITNFLSLISRRSKVNITFLIFCLIVIGGWVSESHDVRLMKYQHPDRTAYQQRMDFYTYIQSWISWHRDTLEKDTSRNFPVFLTLADGGASRSGYWTASVLAKLHEQTRYSKSNHRSYFMDHTLCLSGASGGSVGNAAFLSAYSLQQQHPELQTDVLCRQYLGNDFLVYPLASILGPDLLKPAFGFLKFWGDRAASLEYGIEHPSRGDSRMGDIMQGSFSQFLPNDNNHFPILSINTTRVNDGSPGVVSTISIDSSKNIFGARIDVLGLVPAGRDMRLSTAAVLGARFPYMSPGGKLGKKSYFVDGGYFDNSGAGVIHEMLLALDKLQRDTSNADHKYLKRLQFYVLHFSNTPIPDSTKKEENSIHPALNDLATPLLTLAGSYNSQTNINDARLTNYLRELNRERDSYIIFNLYTPERKENISMNWVISDKARDSMNIRLRDRTAIDELSRRMRTGQVADLLNKLIVDENKSK